MLAFSWNQWLGAITEFAGVAKVRKPRRARLARIEDLEDRALLAAVPVGVSDVFSTNAGTTLNGTSVLTNDTGLGATIDQASLVSDVSHGTLTLSPNGTFVYIPNAGFTGTDSFTYLATDTVNGQTSLTPATAVVHVGTANSAPVATPATINATTNTAFNGTLQGTDANGDPLSFSPGLTAATNGTVTINPNGTFVFTPTPGFNGTGTFSYRVNDGTVNSPDSTVTVNVGAAGANVAPAVSPVTLVTGLNTAANGTLAGTDINGNPLTFSAGSTAATNGSVTINPNGTFTFTPTPGFTGIGTFSFRANDGTVNSTDSTGIVHVGIPNSLPAVSPATVSTNTGTAYHGTLASTDLNGDVVNFTAGSTAATNGSVVISPDGSYVFTPTPGFNGTGTFSFRASDSIGNTIDATQTINIGAGLGQAPTGTPVSVSTGAGTALTGNLQGSTTTGNPLTFAAGTTAAAHGTVTINPNGSYIYTPNPGFVGVDTFSFKTSDGTQTSQNSNVTVHVGGSNTLPTVQNMAFSTNTGSTLTGTLAGKDLNGDPLTFSAGSTAAANGTVQINPNGTFTFAPNAGFAGPATFSFKANDSLGNSTDATATVNVGSGLNQAPIGTPSTFNTAANTSVAGNLLGTDVNGNSLTFAAGTVAAAHGTAVINSNGSFTYTPTPGFTGTDSFTFQANDSSLSSPNAVATVNVGLPNSLPVVTGGTVSTNTGTAFHGTLSASDANGNALSFAARATPATNGSVVINPDGTYVFTPTPGFTGTGTFSFRASDGTGNSTDATQSINIGAGLGQAPTGTPVSIATGVGTAISGNLQGSNTTGNPLTFAAGTTAAAHGTVTINPNGSYVYTPNPGFVGVDTFSFKTAQSSQNANVTVHVGGANSLPTVQNMTFSTNTGSALSGTLAGTDLNGDPLTFSAGSTPVANGTVQINPNGTFTFTPTAGFTGPATFSFNANDSLGTSTDATATVNVGAGLNQAPVGTSSSITTAVNTPFTGSLQATDVNGNNLTFSAGTIAAAHGTVAINSNGTFTYTPTTGYNGPDSFTFQANDSSLTSPNATVNVQVGAINTAPTVVNGSGTTDFGTNLNGSLLNLGTDAEGNPLTFAVVGQPAHGSVTVNPNGTFNYVPNAGFSGSDSFTFKANDATLGSNVGTFNVTVNPEIPVGDAIELDLASDGTIATRPKSVAPLDSSASLTVNDDSVRFGNATITASISEGGDSRHDRLVIVRHDPRVRVRGHKILVDGSEIATFSGGTRGAPLRVTFNSKATADDVNSVLQSIAARTTRNSGSAVRTIDFEVLAGGESADGSIDATKI